MERSCPRNQTIKPTPQFTKIASVRGQTSGSLGPLGLPSHESSRAGEAVKPVKLPEVISNKKENKHE